MTSQPTTAPPVNLKAALQRAAITYATFAGPLEGIEVPLHVALSLRWEDGAARIEIGDADTAEQVADRLDLPYQADASGARTHHWSGIVHDQRVTITGHGSLGTDPDVIRRRERAAARRKLNLLVPQGRPVYVIDVRA